MSWRGWVKMFFHQPLVPVLPVARELISKTKWIASKGHLGNLPDVPKLQPSKAIEEDPLQKQRARSRSPRRPWRRGSRKKQETQSSSLPPAPLSMESEPTAEQVTRSSRPSSRARMLSLFSRSPSRKSMESSNTVCHPVRDISMANLPPARIFEFSSLVHRTATM
jgi:hypothetical protein